MFLTTHITVGAAVSVATGNPVAGFVAALASHHVLDKIPHVDVGSAYAGTEEPKSLSDLKLWEKGLIVADIVVALIILLVFTSRYFNPALDVYIGDLWTEKNSLLLWGVIGASLPDFFYQGAKMIKGKFAYLFEGKPFNYYHQFHESLHKTIGWKWWHVGLANQLILIGASLWWLILRVGN